MQNDVGHMTTSAVLVCKSFVREVHYDCLTTRQISSCKTRIFLGLLTYTNDLREPQGKKKSKELSDMTLVAIDDHHYAR